MTLNDVTTSFWRHNDVIIVSCAHWGVSDLFEETQQLESRALKIFEDYINQM